MPVRRALSKRPELNAGGYYNYFTFGLSGYIDRVLVRIRREIVEQFTTAFAPTSEHTVLDVGVSPSDHISSNYFERTYPYLNRICALSVWPHPELKEQFPGITIVVGNALALPFKSKSFDFVYSHAVIEHVGVREEQATFVAEAVRVAKRGVFFTTPNRWHPVETHTGLPLMHYLPASVYVRLYRVLGKTMYGSQEKLNLLSSRDLRGLLRQAKLPVKSVSVLGVRWLSVVSNWVAIIRKDSTTCASRPHDRVSDHRH